MATTTSGTGPGLRGRFWLQGAPEGEAISGRLFLGAGSHPLLELDEVLTPLTRETSRRKLPDGGEVVTSSLVSPQELVGRSLTIHGELETGELVTLARAFAVAASVPEVVAVGVNCCAPADVLTAIAAAREVTGKPVIVYPSSGEDWDARRRAWTGQSRYSAGQPRQWMAGARIAGGCCRVRPAAIAVIAEAAAAVGHAPAS